MDKITNHDYEAEKRLVSQFRDKEKILGLVRSFSTQFQAIEDAIFNLLAERTVQNADGALLDIFGQIVNEDRGGRNDDEYRLAILARIAINISKATPEDAITIFALLTGASQVLLLEWFPGVVSLYANTDYTAKDVSKLYVIMDQVIAAGVRIDTLGEYHPTTPFGFAANPRAFGFGRGKFARAFAP